MCIRDSPQRVQDDHGCPPARHRATERACRPVEYRSAPSTSLLPVGAVQRAELLDRQPVPKQIRELTPRVHAASESPFEVKSEFFVQPLRRLVDGINRNIRLLVPKFLKVI